MEAQVIKSSETKRNIKSLEDVKKAWIEKGVKYIEEHWAKFNSTTPRLISLKAVRDNQIYVASTQFNTNNILCYVNQDLVRIIDVNA